ncbi:MAG TPA: RIO1 family regulatory kinase/ATPase [Chloroflexota bacterium]|nr:RIO1 family regulatory kinase/ATPase [Chloroflexota bacterium]
MPKIVIIPDADAWDDYLESQERGRRSRPSRKGPESDHNSEPTSDFHPTFTGSRHEREWITRYLAPFHRDQQILDVLRVVKGGKEATVYCCRAHPSTGLDLIAAKVYRPKQFRTFKNDADYKWGRPILDGDGKAVRDKRMLKAVRQGSRAGASTSHTSWLTHEFTTLQTLHTAGADVPRPIALDENALLMSYVGDEHTPAPTLSEVRIAPNEAQTLFTRILRTIELMLEHDRIHGDLSAYNVLYWEGGITVIDFPQVIDAYGNPDAYRFLVRDVERICSYFARFGISSDARAIAAGMWRRFMPDETFRIRGSRAGW